MPLLLVVSLALTFGMCVMAGSPLLANRFNAAIWTMPLLVAATIGVAVWSNPTVDRLVYAKQLLLLREVAAPWDSEYFTRDPLFSVFLWVLGRGGATSPTVLFACTAVVLLGAYFVTCWLLGMQSWAVAGALMTLIFSGYFAAYSGVAVRQGLALAGLLVGIGLVVRRDRLTPAALPFLVAAGLLHWSAALFALTFVVLALVRPPLKLLLGGWSVALVLGLSGIAPLLVSPFHLTMVDTYSSNSAYESYGRTGLRLDFVLVSVVLAILSFVVTKRWHTRQGEWLAATFLAFNSLYLLLGYVAFSDRLAVYSLILVPLAAWYALSTVQRTRGVALPVAALFAGVLVLGVQSGQWDMVSGWW